MSHTIPSKLLVIIVGALLVRLLLLSTVFSFLGEKALIFGDASRFYKIAEVLKDGHGFTDGEPSLAPAAVFPPVFFMALAASLKLAHSVIPLLILQIVLAALIPLVVWNMALLFTQDMRVRTLAAGLAAFEPQMVLWSLLPVTETIATFFLLCGLYFFLKTIMGQRWQQAALSGIFLGLSTLTRPHGQFLFILGTISLVVWALYRTLKSIPARSIISAALIFMAAFMLVVSPWIIRNYYRFGTISIASTGLRNLYSDFATSVLTIHSERSGNFGDIRRGLYQELADKHGITREQLRKNPELGKIAAREAVMIIARYPKDAVQVVVIALGAFFTQDLYTYYLEKFEIIPHFSLDFSPSVVLLKHGPKMLVEMIYNKLGWYALIPLMARIFWVGMFLGALWGLWRAIKESGNARATALILAVVVGYYALVSLVGGFADQGRLRYPVSSLLFMLASFGWFNLFCRNGPESIP